MNTAKTIFIAALFLFMGIYAHAQKEMLATGNDLIKTWRSYQKWHLESNYESTTCLEAGLFMGFVKGIAEAALRSDWGVFPATVTHGQIYMVVGKYLEDHPEELHYPAYELVMRSLAKAFPKTNENAYSGETGHRF
jgi:hypothetical protein